MITVGLILLALANLYIVVRFIRWIRDLPPEQLDETTAMVIRKPITSADLPVRPGRFHQGGRRK